jgi:hypothetical protein
LAQPAVAPHELSSVWRHFVQCIAPDGRSGKCLLAAALLMLRGLLLPQEREAEAQEENRARGLEYPSIPPIVHTRHSSECGRRPCEIPERSPPTTSRRRRWCLFATWVPLIINPIDHEIGVGRLRYGLSFRIGPVANERIITTGPLQKAVSPSPSFAHPRASAPRSAALGVGQADSLAAGSLRSGDYEERYKRNCTSEQ